MMYHGKLHRLTIRINYLFISLGLRKKTTGMIQHGRNSKKENLMFFSSINASYTCLIEEGIRKKRLLHILCELACKWHTPDFCASFVRLWYTF